ncbi:MAG: S41 family peptidase [Gemmatimonadales bacterium]
MHCNKQSSRHAVGWAALLLATLGGRLPAQQRAAYEELQAFSGVLNHVRMNYVDSVSYAQLVHAAIDGLLRALDPHSAFYSRLDYDKLNAIERGELAVTGLALEEVDSAVTVLGVAPRSPAAKAGIQPGDRLVMVNDTAVAGIPVRALELRLAGSKGSKVRLRLERGPRLEPDTLAVTVKRDFLQARSVSVARMVDSLTGLVRLEEFGAEAGKEVHDALNRLKGERMRRAVLDLRGNPGGSVISAVEVAAEFFPKGTVVFRTRGRKRDVDTTYVTKRDGAFRDLPLIVLIDEHSASAAEALAGSLQDHDRALLVGRRSFGKALMQTAFVVPPSGEILMLTIGHVLSPSGRFIQRRYRGLAAEQYRSLAGKGGAEEDTLQEYQTDAGRVVRGGGGIAPDVELARPAPLPVWWSVAADSGFDDAVADSVALTLPADLGARRVWLLARDVWRSTLLPPFLARVRTRLKVAAQTDSALDARLAFTLAARVAEVRWGPDARDEFVFRPPAALDYFPRLDSLLAPPRR